MSRPSRAAAVKAASRIRGVYEWEGCAETSQRFQEMAAAMEDNFQREEDDDDASEEYDDSAQSDASEDEESEEDGSYESSFVSKSDDSDRDDDEEYVVPTHAGQVPGAAAGEDVGEPSDSPGPGDTQRALSPAAIDESYQWTCGVFPDTPGPSTAGYSFDAPPMAELGYAVDEPWTPGAASPPGTSWTPGYYAGRSSPRSPSPCKRQRLSRWVSGQLRSPSVEARGPGQLRAPSVEARGPGQSRDEGPSEQAAAERGAPAS